MIFRLIGLWIVCGACTLLNAAEAKVLSDFHQPLAGTAAKLAGSLPVKQNTENGTLVFGCEPSRDVSLSASVTIPMPSVAQGVLCITFPVTIGDTSPEGHGQLSGIWRFEILDGSGKSVPAFSISSTRYHHDRQLSFADGNRIFNVPFNFPTNTKLDLKLALNTVDRTWCGMVYQGKDRLFTTEIRPLSASFSPKTVRVSAIVTNRNDGLNMTAESPSYETFTVADWEKRQSETVQNCSTLPRGYHSVNSKLYNSAFTSLASANTGDRFALSLPEAAEARAKALHELGFTAVLYNGRHFRANFTDEFDDIAEAGRVVREACAKYGIRVIEHHDPTILSYRGYPRMLATLDWLQRDIRSGESNYWYCAANPDFMGDYLVYLQNLQNKAHLAGFMIDELNLAGANYCGCDVCRARFEAETGYRAPVVLNHSAPSTVQRRFRSWGMRMTNLANNSILNVLQEIDPETILMTYCSDFGDPVSQSIDLTEAAALYSPFVGWENMICSPYDSFTSMLCNLKMRNSYGDFYNIPVWSLNREATSKEEHYVEWAMCQATRHAIWYGRVPLDNPDDVAYFKRYNSWEKIMPHADARTLTDTAILLSLQTWRVTTDRRFFWEDFRGTLDTFLRSGRQFDTLLDGDLFYPGRLGKYKVLILPSQAALSDRQCETIEEFVKNGGTVIATNNTSLYDENGNRRVDFKLGKAMNLTDLGKAFGKSAANFSLDGTPQNMEVPMANAVELLDPVRSKVLADYRDPDGKTMPLVVATPYGKGRFYYIAAPYGRWLFELELRNGRPYAGPLDAKLAVILNALYDEAHRKNPVPVKLELPKNVLGIANQLQSGENAGTLYVQLMNFTGSSIKPGEKRANGVATPITFPALTQPMLITVNQPCEDEAVLESPERADVRIKGEKHGASTTFTIMPDALGFFAQLKIAAKPYSFMKIQEPPIAIPDLAMTKPHAVMPEFAELYEEPKLDGTIVPQFTAPAAEKGFGWDQDGKLTLDGKLLLAQDGFLQSRHEYKEELREAALVPEKTLGWQKQSAVGSLASGRIWDNDVVWVREMTRLAPNRLEITLAARVRPKDYQGSNNSYTLRIPVAFLKGAEGTALVGMHRSNNPLKKFQLTGEEPDGVVCDSIRFVQFQGGTSDFSIDFACMGPWGLYVEDLSSQYKAHMLKDGDHYVFYLPSNDSRYGTKFWSKIVFRSGVSDVNKLHPQQFMQYQYGRPAAHRLQFTPEADGAKGFRITSIKGFDNDFSVAPMDNWGDASRVELKKFGNLAENPIFGVAAVGEGENSYAFEAEDGIALLNVMFSGANGATAGTLSVNGKAPQAYAVEAGKNTTLLIPLQIQNHKVELKWRGKWAVSGLVLQMLAYPEEDFLWSRNYWNCGLAPWLLKELEFAPEDWRGFSDIPFRRAKPIAELEKLLKK